VLRALPASGRVKKETRSREVSLIPLHACATVLRLENFAVTEGLTSFFCSTHFC
jgi:hypothetical protein